MSDTHHALAELIAAADRAISAEDFDTLMTFYTEDASLVVKPGLLARGKAQIRQAFVAIAEYFQHDLSVSQGAMQVVEAGDTALVIMETHLQGKMLNGIVTRRATYVFRRELEGRWRCAVDNSYGTDLLIHSE